MSEHHLPPLGPVQALRIGLADGFEAKVGEMVREGRLTLHDAPDLTQAMPA